MESPCDSNDQVDDICLDDLDSADLTPAGVSRDGDKGLFCEECLEWFSTPEELKQHEYSHNSGETPFQCNVSGLIRSSAYTEHLQYWFIHVPLSVDTCVFILINYFSLNHYLCLQLEAFYCLFFWIG